MKIPYFSKSNFLRPFGFLVLHLVTKCSYLSFHVTKAYLFFIFSSLAYGDCWCVWIFEGLPLWNEGQQWTMCFSRGKAAFLSYLFFNSFISFCTIEVLLFTLTCLCTNLSKSQVAQGSICKYFFLCFSFVNISCPPSTLSIYIF